MSYFQFQDEAARSVDSTAATEAGATLILNADNLSYMSVKSLNLTSKTLGSTPLELQTDGDVQRRDISHLDGRELQVRSFIHYIVSTSCLRS